jgi:hypothetical protein
LQNGFPCGQQAVAKRLVVVGKMGEEEETERGRGREERKALCSAFTHTLFFPERA